MRTTIESKSNEGQPTITGDDFRLLLDSIAESIYGVDLNGNCTFCNASFLTTLGYTDTSQLVGRNIHDLIHYKHADGTPYPNHECTILKSITTGKAVHADNEVFWRADGTSFPVEFWCYPQYRQGQMVGNVVTFMDITKRKQAYQREQTRSKVLELLYNGEPLNQILETMVLGVQQLNTEMLCSILLLDAAGTHLFTAAAPSFPASYNQSIDGVQIGIGVGSCGTAAYTGERVIVADINTHPYWQPYKQLAALVGVQSSWSEPIKDSNGKVLGTFAIYHKYINTPTENDINLIKQNADLAAIVIERFNASDKLKESEAKYRSLFENSPDIIMTIDLNDTIKMINYTGGGFTKEQVVGTSAFNFVDKEYHTLVRDTHKKVIATKTTQSYETVAHGLDGVSRCFLTNAGPIFSGDKVIGITLITRDISERKKVEQEVERSLSILEATLESTADGILVADNHGKIIRFNKKFAELWRIPNSILETQEDEKALAFVLDQLISPEQFLSKVKELYITPEAVSFDTLEFKDGRTFERYSQPQVINNNYKGRVWSFRDITQRKRAELEVMVLMNNTEENFVLVDHDLKIVSFNEQFKTNYSKYIGKEVKHNDSILDYVLPERKELVAAVYKRVLSGERAETEFEVPLPDKSKLTFINRFKPTYDSNGTIVGAFVTIIDITDRKKAEESVRKSQVELRNLTAHLQTIREEEGTRIAREIHDELGQQLTGIKMDASWIKKKLPASDKLMQEKLADMVALTDETMKTVRRIAAELRPVILDDLGLIAALEWQSNEFEKRTKVSCIFTPHFNTLNVDKKLATGIFRVYQETLTNITRHANAKRVLVDIKKTKQTLTLSIKDDGSGFDVDEIKNKHTLGLIGMNERAIMIGGELTIESKKKEGTTVILNVPLQPGKATN